MEELMDHWHDSDAPAAHILALADARDLDVLLDPARVTAWVRCHGIGEDGTAHFGRVEVGRWYRRLRWIRWTRTRSEQVESMPKLDHS